LNNFLRLDIVMASHNIKTRFSMAYHTLEEASESEQMYLVTAFRLEEKGAAPPIPLSTLAQELSVLPVSVHQMARKMAEEGMVEYIPYKGLALTSEGKRIATRILRSRRLWEVFMVDCLKIPFEDAEAFACSIEHATSPEIAERLSQYLGNPQVSPKGKTIPSAEENQPILSWIPLTRLTAGQTFSVMQIETSPAERQFLISEGLQPGATASVRSVGGQGAFLLEINGHSLYLSLELAASIMVLPLMKE
jgi:DtxR family transcriptional regulator, Mn-dependent transcriptional regulator